LELGKLVQARVTCRREVISDGLHNFHLSGHTAVLSTNVQETLPAIKYLSFHSSDWWSYPANARVVEAAPLVLWTRMVKLSTITEIPQKRLQFRRLSATVDISITGMELNTTTYQNFLTLTFRQKVKS